MNILENVLYQVTFKLLLRIIQYYYSLFMIIPYSTYVRRRVATTTEVKLITGTHLDLKTDKTHCTRYYFYQHPSWEPRHCTGALTQSNHGPFLTMYPRPGKFSWNTRIKSLLSAALSMSSIRVSYAWVILVSAKKAQSGFWTVVTCAGNR